MTKSVVIKFTEGIKSNTAAEDCHGLKMLQQWDQRLDGINGDGWGQDLKGRRKGKDMVILTFSPDGTLLCCGFFWFILKNEE